MSRIGKMPVEIPSGVTVSIDKENVVTVKGPKATLTQKIAGTIAVNVDEGTVTLSRKSNDPRQRALHGLSRSLLFNMVKGVSEGYQKDLDVVGVGYRAAKQGNSLVMNLGYSHQVIMEEIPGITIEVPAPNKIIVKGADKQAVGQFAAEIREKRPPEPYLGKGIRYTGEVIVLKEGKTGAKKK